MRDAVEFRIREREIEIRWLEHIIHYVHLDDTRRQIREKIRGLHAQNEQDGIGLAVKRTR